MENGTVSQEEHDEVVRYVLNRPLVRPDTSYTKVLFYTIIFVFVNCVGVVLLYKMFFLLAIPPLMPESMVKFIVNHRTGFIMCLVAAQFLVGCILVMKRALIGAVHLYQRYAPEYMRRKCLFKPTCSEYAILAIEKYGVVRGLLKTYDRVFVRCKGRTYRIDEP